MTESMLGVIGGSGLYTLLDDAHDTTVSTPYGPTSDPVTVGYLGGRRVAFLPRHGRKHQHPAHMVNYRANIWALHKLGVDQILSIAAVGSLRRDVPRGAIVVPDQLVDRTSGRKQTYFDGPETAHASFADPYCPAGRTAAVRASGHSGWSVVDGGVLVVIEGPRFSTRAESRWYAAQGWSIIGMTGHPEAVLARELGLCYTPLCLVTDYDAGVEAGEGVTQEEVIAAFTENIGRLREVIGRHAGTAPGREACGCEGLRPGVL